MFELSENLAADRLQSALTRRFLTPALPALEVMFLALRSETDRALSAGAAARYGKPYPYGFCREITADILRRLNGRSPHPRSPGERALTAFLNNGGVGRMVWGVLRDRYFQNALQLGSLYVDVSNDTVDVRKPKVEILPLRESGFSLVRDAAHFASIGETYWDVRFYANTALPSLAPAFPMIAVDRDGRAQMQTKVAYMMRLFCADGFRRAEQWLREGPVPPQEVVQAMRRVCPDDMLWPDPEFGAAAALKACERLRAAGTIADATWMRRMQSLFDRAPVARILESQAATPRRADISDSKRSNARRSAGIEGCPA